MASDLNPDKNYGRAGFSLILFLHLKCLSLTWRLLRGQFAQEKRKQKRKSSKNFAQTQFGRDKKEKVTSSASF